MEYDHTIESTLRRMRVQRKQVETVGAKPRTGAVTFAFRRGQFDIIVCHLLNTAADVYTLPPTISRCLSGYDAITGAINCAWHPPNSEKNNCGIDKDIIDNICSNQAAHHVLTMTSCTVISVIPFAGAIVGHHITKKERGLHHSHHIPSPCGNLQCAPA